MPPIVNGSTAFRRPDVTPVALGSVSPIPQTTAYHASEPIDVRGASWLNFRIAITGNTGGAPNHTVLDGYVEVRYERGTGDWIRVRLEDKNVVTGDATSVNYHWIHSIAGGVVESASVPVPVDPFAAEARILVAGNSAAAAAGSTATISALRKA
jgi:hypothetical protein